MIRYSIPYYKPQTTHHILYTVRCVLRVTHARTMARPTYVPTCVSNVTLPCLCWHGWWPMGSLSFGGRTCAYTRKRDTQPWRTSKHIDAHVRTCVLGDASKSMMACTYGSISWPYIACFSPSPILPSSWLTPSRRASYFAKIGEGEKQGGRAPRPPRVRFLQSTR